MIENLKKIHYKVFALKIKRDSGKFPLLADWTLKNNYPTTSKKLLSLFKGSYNNFKIFCGEPTKRRTQEVTLSWIKSVCYIDENQCWNWSKAKINSYGSITNNSKQYLTHRFVYELVNGDIPDKYVVRHKCDNKICCNPEHLEIGTYSQNSLDMVIRNPNYTYTNNVSLGHKVRGLTLKEKSEYYLLHTEYLDSGCLISTLLKPHHTLYYQIKSNNKSYALHRLILANKLNKEYAEIDIARHVCHNKSCINPDHLTEGSRSDNTIDSLFYNSQVKLNKEKVLEIKNSSSINDKLYAEKFKVTEGTIANVRNGKTWSHINNV